jgi:hypothetical protein
MKYEAPVVNVIAFDVKEAIASFGDVEVDFSGMISANCKP